ncbi:MAG: thioredoxin family protein [Myxococcales bacterium]|nr:thioredoxin family protein [Myxococcales bacterium]
MTDDGSKNADDEKSTEPGDAASGDDAAEQVTGSTAEGETDTRTSESDEDAASSDAASAADSNAASSESSDSDSDSSAASSDSDASDADSDSSSDTSDSDASDAGSTESSNTSEDAEAAPAEAETADAKTSEGGSAAAEELAREAEAARDAVEDAGKPEAPRYPTPDAKAQKLAGWGCIVLLIVLTVGFVVVFRVAFVRLTSLDTNLNGYDVSTYVAPGDETRRPDRDPTRRSQATAPAGGGVEWRTDVAEAFEEARRMGRPLLLHFEARWAAASRDMLDGTYANVAVREALAEFVPVRVDVTERDAAEQELMLRYAVGALPHVLYLAPDGDRLRPDSTILVDASDMEVFLREALGAYEDGRRFEEPTTAPPPAP